MKRIFLLLFISVSTAMSAEDKQDQNTIILTEEGVKNLNIKTVRARKANFESSIFAIGRIQPLPHKTSVISTRFEGRIVQTPPIVGDKVEEGQTLLKVESRQPGSPPPVIDVKSPSTGVIIKSHVTLGQPVEPAQELMDIANLDQVWAVANVPESQASKLAIGSIAHIHVSSFGDTLFKGKLIRFGAEANATAGTVEAIFLLDNPEMKLRPNMRTEFSIVTSSRENVVSVPRSAIQGDLASPFVFVKHYDLKNAFVKVPVVIGEKNDRFAEITSGITRFDDVVTEGSYFLSFAQGGGVSLKEALDAAHGHEHNEDGSELTAAQKSDKNQDQSPAVGGAIPLYKQPAVIFLVITNVISLAVLGFVSIRKSQH